MANKAQAIYANYLEKSEKTKLALFLEVAERAEAQHARRPEERRTRYYCMAYALGRYSQGISVAKALAQGLGSKVKSALETTIKLQPKHADAHIALGTFHAEVIDKVGSLLGRTQGASKDAGLTMFKTALKLNPTSAIAMVEYANGLVMLEGDKKMKEADEALRRRRRVRAARRDGAARRGDGEGRAGGLGLHLTQGACMPGRHRRSRRQASARRLSPRQHQRHQQQLLELRLEAVDDLPAGRGTASRR